MRLEIQTHHINYVTINSQTIYGCLVETQDPYHPHYIDALIFNFHSTSLQYYYNIRNRNKQLLFLYNFRIIVYYLIIKQNIIRVYFNDKPTGQWSLPMYSGQINASSIWSSNDFDITK